MNRFLLTVYLAFLMLLFQSCGPGVHIKPNSKSDLPSLGLRVEDASAPQGESLVFKITLSEVYHEDITVKYSTLNITAKNPEDFIPESDSEIRVPAGNNNVSIQIPTYNNRDISQPVSVIIIVESVGEGAAISKEIAVGTISPAQ